MRKPIIAGNWKMYKTLNDSVAFFKTFLPLIGDHTRDEVRIFPSFTSLAPALQATAGSSVDIGAQTMHWLDEGAYTGETSPSMLLALGCRHVLLGHSEQRMYFSETDERINLKLKSAIAHGIHPIVCVGELLSEREQSKTEEVLRTQVHGALKNITAGEARHLVIAYEPVWCIGTGLTASPEMAADAHRIVRSELAHCLDEQAAQNTRILYGGSVKPENISALMAAEEIDGALVGGASLVPASFAAIVKYA